MSGWARTSDRFVMCRLEGGGVLDILWESLEDENA
jgi:hypothetical protein